MRPTAAESRCLCRNRSSISFELSVSSRLRSTKSGIGLVQLRLGGRKQRLKALFLRFREFRTCEQILNVCDLGFQGYEAVGYRSPNVIRDGFAGWHTTPPVSDMERLRLTLSLSARFLCDSEHSQRLHRNICGIGSWIILLCYHYPCARGACSSTVRAADS